MNPNDGTQRPAQRQYQPRTDERPYSYHPRTPVPPTAAPPPSMPYAPRQAQYSTAANAPLPAYQPGSMPVPAYVTQPSIALPPGYAAMAAPPAPITTAAGVTTWPPTQVDALRGIVIGRPTSATAGPVLLYPHQQWSQPSNEPSAQSATAVPAVDSAATPGAGTTASVLTDASAAPAASMVTGSQSVSESTTSTPAPTAASSSAAPATTSVSEAAPAAPARAAAPSSQDKAGSTTSAASKGTDREKTSSKASGSGWTSSSSSIPSVPMLARSLPKSYKYDHVATEELDSTYPNTPLLKEPLPSFAGLYIIASKAMHYKMSRYHPLKYAEGDMTDAFWIHKKLVPRSLVKIWRDGREERMRIKALVAEQEERAAAARKAAEEAERKAAEEAERKAAEEAAAAEALEAAFGTAPGPANDETMQPEVVPEVAEPVADPEAAPEVAANETLPPAVPEVANKGASPEVAADATANEAESHEAEPELNARDPSSKQKRKASSPPRQAEAIEEDGPTGKRMRMDTGSADAPTAQAVEPPAQSGSGSTTSVTSASKDGVDGEKPAAKRRGGRPRGSKNKVTSQIPVPLHRSANGVLEVDEEEEDELVDEDVSADMSALVVPKGMATKRGEVPSRDAEESDPEALIARVIKSRPQPIVNTSTRRDEPLIEISASRSSPLAKPTQARVVDLTVGDDEEEDKTPDWTGPPSRVMSESKRRRGGATAGNQARLTEKDRKGTLGNRTASASDAHTAPSGRGARASASSARGVQNGRRTRMRERDASSPVDEFLSQPQAIVSAEELARRAIPRVGGWIVPVPPPRATTQAVTTGPGALRKKEASAETRPKSDNFAVVVPVKPPPREGEFGPEVALGDAFSRLRDQHPDVATLRSTEDLAHVLSETVLNPTSTEAGPAASAEPTAMPVVTSRVTDTAVAGASQGVPANGEAQQVEFLRNLSIADLEKYILESEAIPNFIKNQLADLCETLTPDRDSVATATPKKSFTSTMQLDRIPILASKPTWWLDLDLGKDAQSGRGDTVVVVVELGTEQHRVTAYGASRELAQSMLQVPALSPWFDSEGRRRDNDGRLDLSYAQPTRRQGIEQGAQTGTLQDELSVAVVEYRNELVATKRELARVQAALEAEEAAKAEVEAQSNFRQSQYNEASTRAVELSREVMALEEELAKCKRQIADGLAAQRLFAQTAAEQYKTELAALRQENAVLRAQARNTDDAVRRRAAEYDTLRALQLSRKQGAKGPTRQRVGSEDIFDASPLKGVASNRSRSHGAAAATSGGGSTPAQGVAPQRQGQPPGNLTRPQAGAAAPSLPPARNGQANASAAMDISAEM